MKDIEKFREAINPYLDRWRSIDVRTVCFLTYQKWVSMGTRIVLSQSAVDAPNDQAMLPTMPHLCALHEVRAIAELDELLSQIQVGTLRVADKEIHFGAIEGSEVKIAAPNFQLRQARRGTNHFQIEYPYVSLTHGGQGLHNLLHNHEQAPTQDDIDWKLRSLKAPYNGLEDLLINFLGLPRPDYGGIQSALTEIVAPFGIRLGIESMLSNGKLTVQIEGVSGQNVEDISLGVIALSGRSPVNRTAHALAKDDWEGNPGVVKKEVLIGSASSAVIFLTYKNNVLDMQTVSDPGVLLNNPRILAYSHFDQGLSVLNGYLGGKGGDQSTDFEVGIGLLFHFCGFNVGPYGGVKALQSKSIQEEIDHVVFAPSGSHIIAIECTKKDLDINGKLSKFSRRVKTLSALLPAFTITPLICTPLGKATIAKSDIEKASKEHMGVVAAEEIQTVLEMAGQNKEPKEILEFLNDLIIKPEDMPFWST